MRKHSVAASVACVGAALVAATAMSATARADSNSALGLWVDHTGRGAIEITDCGGKLCGHVAWLKDSEFSDQCGKQIIGNVQPVGKNKWDRGWIFDPDRGSKFDVELTLLGADRMRVKGYAGLKWLSESHTWKRAPADMQKCSAAANGETTAAAPATETPRAETAAAPPAPAYGASDRKTHQADGSKPDVGNRPANADSSEAGRTGTGKSANLSPPNVGQSGVIVLNAPENSGQAASPPAAPTEAGKKPDAAKQAATARDDETPRTARRTDGATSNGDRSDDRKAAKREREAGRDEMARADDMDEYDSEADEPPRRGRVLARLMEKLESGDGPVKLRRAGRNCSVEVPYAGVISFPCERQ